MYVKGWMQIDYKLIDLQIDHSLIGLMVDYKDIYLTTQMIDYKLTQSFECSVIICWSICSQK